MPHLVSGCGLQRLQTQTNLSAMSMIERSQSLLHAPGTVCRLPPMQCHRVTSRLWTLATNRQAEAQYRCLDVVVRLNQQRLCYSIIFSYFIFFLYLQLCVMHVPAVATAALCLSHDHKVGLVWYSIQTIIIPSHYSELYMIVRILYWYFYWLLSIATWWAVRRRTSPWSCSLRPSCWLQLE